MHGLGADPFGLGAIPPAASAVAADSTLSFFYSLGCLALDAGMALGSQSNVDIDKNQAVLKMGQESCIALPLHEFIST
jgi:hypothetical protein